MIIGVLIGSSIISVTAQSPVDVAESTLKVPAFGEAVFYYGFAAGDQLVFTFNEVNSKELKELEIIELPSSSKFMDYKTKKVENKSLAIARTAIYKFRFANSAISGRICKFKIQRIPASSAIQNFNTNVYWRTAYDTTYVPVQERYLAKSDTIISQPLDQVTKVSSQNAVNGNANRTTVEIDLPPETVSWSYYIGAGLDSKQAYEDAKEKFVNNAAAKLSLIPGYGPMAALALFGLNTFSKLQAGNNVKYYFIADWQNVLQFDSGQRFFEIKQGDIINEAAQMRTPQLQKIYVGLVNDNLLEPINVMIRVTAVQVHQTWAVRTVNQLKINTYDIPYLVN